MIVLHEEQATKLINALNDVHLGFNGRMLTLLAALENATIQQSAEQSYSSNHLLFHTHMKVMRESLLSNIT